MQFYSNYSKAQYPVIAIAVVLFGSPNLVLQKRSKSRVIKTDCSLFFTNKTTKKEKNEWEIFKQQIVGYDLFRSPHFRFKAQNLMQVMKEKGLTIESLTFNL